MNRMGRDEAILPRSGMAGSIPWLVAAMTCLSMLGLALALALTPAAAALSGEIAGRASVQIVETDGQSRLAMVRAVEQALRPAPFVRALRVVPEEELRGMAAQWLGEGMEEAGLPLPALVDVDLAAGADAMERLRTAVAQVAPDARIIAHADWLGPVAGLIASVGWAAALVAAVLIAAGAATAVLAARAIIAAQAGTIDILHLVGATDVQIARLVQRRIARATAIGAVIGGLAAIFVGLLAAQRLDAVAGGLSGPVSPWRWLWLLAVPPAVVVIATISARIAVLRALEERL